MVESIQGMGYSQPMGMFQSKALTDDQKSQVETILSDYDVDNLTADDARSIMSELRDAGIQPGKDLDEVLEANGVDGKELFSLGRPEGASDKPPMGFGSTSNTKMDVDSLQTFKSILEQYDLSSMTEEDQDELYNQLSQAGLTSGTGQIFDLAA